MRYILSLFIAVLVLGVSQQLVSAQGKSGGAKQIRIEKTNGRLEVSTSTNDEEETNYYKGNSIIRFHSRAGISKLTIEDEDGKVEEQILLGEDDEVEIGDDSTDSGKIKIDRRSGDFTIENNGIRTRSNFPLTVDPATNTLIITTPAGVKTVILPSVAIANMITKGLFDTIATPTPEPTEDPDATESGELVDEINYVTLVVDDEGLLIYEIDGVDTQRFLGIFPVGIRKKVRVAAETGELISVSSPFFQRLLDLFSF